MADRLSDFLVTPGADQGRVIPKGEMARTLLEFAPVTGEALSAADMVKSANKGDLPGALIGLAGAIPFVGMAGRGAKAATKVLRSIDIPGVGKRPIPLEDEIEGIMDFFSGKTNPTGVPLPEEEALMAKTLMQTGLEKARIAKDPAFVDAAETVAEVMKAFTNPAVVRDRELSGKLLETLDFAKQTLDKKAVERGFPVKEVFPVRTKRKVFLSGRESVHETANMGDGRVLDIEYTQSTFPENVAQKGFEMVFAVDGMMDPSVVKTTRGNLSKTLASKDDLIAMGTVMDSLDRFLKRESPDFVEFFPAEPILGEVYSRFAPRIAKANGYSFGIEPGVANTTFYMRKGK